MRTIESSILIFSTLIIFPCLYFYQPPGHYSMLLVILIFCFSYLSCRKRPIRQSIDAFFQKQEKYIENRKTHDKIFECYKLLLIPALSLLFVRLTAPLGSKVFTGVINSLLTLAPLAVALFLLQIRGVLISLDQENEVKRKTFSVAKS